MIVKSCISWVILPHVYYLMGKKLVKFNFNEIWHIYIPSFSFWILTTGFWTLNLCCNWWTEFVLWVVMKLVTKMVFHPFDSQKHVENEMPGYVDKLIVVLVVWQQN